MMELLDNSDNEGDAWGADPGGDESSLENLLFATAIDTQIYTVANLFSRSFAVAATSFSCHIRF